MHPIEKTNKGYHVDDRGFQYTYMQVIASDIKADPRYNRTIRKNHVQRIVSRFDPNILNPCKVSYRDGCYWIFDGNHTLSALVEKHNGKRDFFVDCKVYYGMTYEDEAMLFALQNGDTLRVTKDSTLRAKYEAKDETVLRFKAVTSLAGARVTFNSTNAAHCIKCYTTAYEIFTKYGDEHYKNVIQTIVKVKDGHPDSLRREIISGMDILLRIYKDVIDLDRMAEKLKENDCKMLIANAKGDTFHTGNMRYAAALAAIYNVKLKEPRRLDLSLLYDGR